jgi:hypothetical protein
MGQDTGISAPAPPGSPWTIIDDAVVPTGTSKAIAVSTCSPGLIVTTPPPR